MGQKKTGKLPPEEVIILESGPDIWRLFEEKLISELSMAGIITVEEKRIRVEIEIQTIIPPERFSMNMFFDTLGMIGTLDALDISKAKGISRADKFFFEKICSVRWILFGYVRGINRIPIVIVHYEKIGVSIYAQKLLGEEKKFFPNGISLN